MAYSTCQSYKLDLADAHRAIFLTQYHPKVAKAKYLQEWGRSVLTLINGIKQDKSKILDLANLAAELSLNVHMVENIISPIFDYIRFLKPI